MRRFKVSYHGLTLAAYDNGGDGLPVIFQHGLGGDQGQVEEVFPDAVGLHRLTLECPAHGASPPAAGGYSVAGFADAVLAMADHAGIERFVVGGISMLSLIHI